MNNFPCKLDIVFRFCKLVTGEPFSWPLLRIWTYLLLWDYKCQPAGSLTITECEWEGYWEALDCLWALLDCLMGVLWQCVFLFAEMRFSAWLYQHIYVWYTACLNFAQMTKAIVNRSLLIRKPQICTCSSEKTWTYWELKLRQLWLFQQGI